MDARYLTSPETNLVCQAIFAATVTLGRPDPFLARELAEGAMHFLAKESTAYSEAEVRDEIIKLVRELGHAQLANAIDNYPPTQCQTNRSTPYWPTVDYESPGDNTAKLMAATYPPDLIAACDAGLIGVLDIDLRDRMIGGVIERPGDCRRVDWTDRLTLIRHRFGRFVVFDGVEFYLGAASPRGWIEEMAFALEQTDLRAVLNLNSQAASGNDVTLYSPRQRSLWDLDELEPMRELLAAGLSHPRLNNRVHWRWHLGRSDFDPPRQQVLAWAIGQCVKAVNMTLVFDRPGQPVSLASGIDRNTPAIAQRVEISLSNLLNYLGPDVEFHQFQAKCGSLLRQAAVAGSAKLAHIRSHGSQELRAAFRAERSGQRLTVRGLNETARHFAQAGNKQPENVRRKLVLALSSSVAGDIHPPVRLHLPDLRLKCDFSDARGLDATVAEIISSGSTDVEVLTGPEFAGQLVSLVEMLWRSTGVATVRLRLPPAGGISH